jgi:hypothetical protein
VQYEDFCRAHPPLFPLLFRVEVANAQIKRIRGEPITEVKPGLHVFVDLRSYGATWYASLSLPNLDHSTYVVEYIYQDWVSSSHKKIYAYCPIFDERFQVDHFFVVRYGAVTEFDPRCMTLIDEKFVKLYPEVLPNHASETTPVILKRKGKK